jgi:hypothetical protein
MKMFQVVSNRQKVGNTLNKSYLNQTQQFSDVTKYFVTLIMALIISGNLMGQGTPSAFHSKSKFSLIGGPSLLFVRENELYDQYGVPKIAISAGMGIEKGVTSRIKFQGKILFEKKGFKAAKKDTLNSANGPIIGDLINIYHFNYLTYSLAPQFLMGKKKAVSLGFGLYYSKLLKARWQIIYTPLNSNSSADIIGAYYKHDYGISVNLGYSVAVTKMFMIDFQLTENYGLKRIGLGVPGYQQINNSLVLTMAVRRK